MFIVVCSVVFFVFAVATVTSFIEGLVVICCISVLSAVSIFLFLVLVVSPNELGTGRVPKKRKRYADQLKKETAYQLIFSVDAEDKHGNYGDKVLLVKTVGALEFRAIRVKNGLPPPKFFCLINGSPVALDEMLNANK